MHNAGVLQNVMQPPPPAPMVPVYPPGMDAHSKAPCALHGKVRSADCLVMTADGTGRVVCSPGNECKVTGAGAVPGTPGSDTVCALHGKARGAKYLVPDALGRMCCMPGNECKGAGAPGAQQGLQPCATHGKMRTLECLVHDGKGGLICAPGQECLGGPSGPGIPGRNGPDTTSSGAAAALSAGVNLVAGSFTGGGFDGKPTRPRALARSTSKTKRTRSHSRSKSSRKGKSKSGDRKSNSRERKKTIQKPKESVQRSRPRS